MAQYAVFFVKTIPALGTTTHTLAYRGDHADEAAAVAAAASQLFLKEDHKVWACPIASLTSYTVDATTNRVVTAD